MYNIDIKITGKKVTASFEKTKVTVNSYNNVNMNKTEAIYILEKILKNDK